MKRMELEQAAKIVSKGKTRAGRMSWEEMQLLVDHARKRDIFEALLMAYDGGFYRGAVATKRGQFSRKTREQINTRGGKPPLFLLGKSVVVIGSKCRQKT